MTEIRDDDAGEAQRRRAKRLREQIEAVAKESEEVSSPGDLPRRSPPVSPRKFIHDRMREERDAQ